jgi:DNA-binding NtrC family response regulator
MIFSEHHAVAVSKGIDTISKHVMGTLLDYSWPGNVRELQNVLERAIVLATGRTIDAVDLPNFMEKAQWYENRVAYPGSLDQWMKEQEKQYLVQKLDALGGSVALTAKSSGIGLRTLSRKIRLHDLDPKAFKKTNGGN